MVVCFIVREPLWLIYFVEYGYSQFWGYYIYLRALLKMLLDTMNKIKSIAPVAFMILIAILELIFIHQQEDQKQSNDIINEKYLKFKMKEPVE